MSEKNIYIKLIGYVSVENNYELKITDKKNNTIISKCISQEIKITEKQIEEILKNTSLTFGYQFRKIFEKDSEPNNIYLDIIELKNALNNIGTIKEKEYIEKIINLSINQNNLFFIEIFNTKLIDFNNINSLIKELQEKKLENPIKKVRDKLINLLTFKEEEKQKLKEFYNNHLKDKYEEIKENTRKIYKTNEDIKNDSFIIINSDIREYYSNVSNNILKLKHNNQDFEIKKLFNENTMLTSDFINILNENKYQVASISGKDITAKNYIALNLCLVASKKIYSRFFINPLNKDKIDEILGNIEFYQKQNYQNPLLIVLINIDQILKENIKLNTILTNALKNKSNIIIYTCQDIENIKNTCLDKAYNFEVSPLTNQKYPEFINNLELNAIYEKSEKDSKTVTDLMYKYIENTLGNINNREDREDIEDELKKIAYKALIGEYVYRGHTSNFFRKNIDKLKSIIDVDFNNKNKIKFTLDIVTNYLASEYLFTSSDRKYLKFYTPKLIDISEFLASNIIESNSFTFIIENQKLTSKILHNLRQIKHNFEKKLLELSKKQEEYIDDLELLLEISKDYYSKSEYIKSVNLAIAKRNKENISKDFLNHLASCCLDVYLPEIPIHFLEENNSDPRIMGNKARALLRIGNISDAEKLFKSKLEIHEKENKKFDILRDKSDILFCNSFKQNEPDLKYLKNILDEYDNIYKSNGNDQNMNKSFVLCNLSYYLPLTNDFEKIFKETNKLEEILNDKSKYIIVRYYINLGKYYIKQKNQKESKEYFLKAKDILKDINLKPESYLISLYLYYLGDKDSKIKAKENYDSLKEVAQEVINKLNESKCFDQIFSIDSFSLKDCLNYEGEELLKELNSIIVF